MVLKFSALRAGRQGLTPGRFMVLVSLRRWVGHKVIVRLQGLVQLKNPMTSSGIMILPACNIVTQPTTLPRALNIALIFKLYLNCKIFPFIVLVYTYGFRSVIFVKTSLEANYTRDTVVRFRLEDNVDYQHGRDQKEPLSWKWRSITAVVVAIGLARGQTDSRLVVTTWVKYSLLALLANGLSTGELNSLLYHLA
jgi:hypothetical protein